MFDSAMVQMIWEGILQTLYMTIVSTLFAYIIGLPLGVLLVTSNKDGIAPIPWLYRILDFVVNVLRSVPFLILLVAVTPITRLIAGTSIGSTATIVPLVIAAFPYVARMVESSLKEVSPGLIEAAQSMGATPMQIVTKVLVPEAVPSLIVGAAISITTILGYSAMAGMVGGGGLGDIALRYGYYRYETGVMMVTVVLLVVIVAIFQEIGMRLASHSDKR